MQKHGLKLTRDQIEEAQDGEVVNGCLVLKKEEYKASKFQKRNDFVAVLATKLKKVSPYMFLQSYSLRTVVMLEVEEISGENEEEIDNNGPIYEEIAESDYENDSEDFGDALESDDDQHKNVGSFSFTSVERCFFPRLKRVGTSAFEKCSIKSLDGDSFPALEEVGDSGFAGCPIENINLPYVEKIGKGGFSGCPATQAYLPSLVSIGCGDLKIFSAPKL